MSMDMVRSAKPSACLPRQATPAVAPLTWRIWAVSVDGHDPALFSATSAAKARYEAWLRYSDVWSISFRDFLRICKVRAASVPADDGYGYVRRNYGVDPKIGERYELVNEGPSSGQQGVCVYPGPSTAHVHLVMDGRDYAVTAHPFNVRLVAPEARVTAPSSSDGEGAQHVGEANGKPTEPNTQAGAQ